MAAKLPQYDLGNCTITLVSGGSFKLDGGAMFGLIPKVVWSRSYPTDDQNRITLACNCLLVEWPNMPRRVLIETGCGTKYGEKEQRIFAINPNNWLLPNLAAVDIDPSTITDVVLTHMHFDHAGGLTMERDGQFVPSFPNAAVHVQRQEYEDARAGFGIMTATYREENYTAIDAIQAWRLLDGTQEIVPGIHAIPTRGHTRGHHSIRVDGRQCSLIFAGDLIPTRNHLGAPYNMGYDLYPLDNREYKRELLGWLADNGGLLALDHEPETPIVTVQRKDDWFALSPIVPNNRI